ncbi:hypothetical protein KI387_020976, partial [Taxus chinensis]
SVYFDEIPMQTSREQHATTFVLPTLTDLIVDSSAFKSDEHMHACVDPNPDPNPNWASSDYSLFLIRNQRTRSLVDIYDVPHLFCVTNPIIMPIHSYVIQASDTQTYADAARNTHWEVTMDEEYNSLIMNQTWDLIPIPVNHNIL